MRERHCTNPACRGGPPELPLPLHTCALRKSPVPAVRNLGPLGGGTTEKCCLSWEVTPPSSSRSTAELWLLAVSSWKRGRWPFCGGPQGRSMERPRPLASCPGWPLCFVSRVWQPFRPQGLETPLLESLPTFAWRKQAERRWVWKERALCLWPEP